MKMVSLIELAAEAAYTMDDTRYLSGKIKYTEDFESALQKFDSLNNCTYVYLAFHPKSDDAVTQYVLEDTLAEDAGPNLMALFLSTDQVSLPRRPKRSDLQFGVEVRREEHPAYQVARSFYPNNTLSRVPGLIFFDSVSAPEQSIYFALNGDAATGVRKSCRRAFEAANKSFATPPDAPLELEKPKFDFDLFAARLYDLDMTFHRTDAVGPKAAALLIGVWLKKHVKALSSLIPKLVESVVKAKGGAPPGAGEV